MTNNSYRVVIGSAPPNIARADTAGTSGERVMRAQNLTSLGAGIGRNACGGA